MDKQSGIPLTAFAVIAAGSALSFAASVVPFYEAGYRLAGGVLFASLLPYVAYGALLRVLTPGAAVACGLVLLLIDVAVTVPQRFLHYDGYQSGLIYYVPLAATVVVLPLFMVFGRRPLNPAHGAEGTL